MSTETAATPPAPLRMDFPSWLPPMLVKELRQGLRTRGFVGAFVVFQALMAVLLIGTVGGSSLGNAAARAMAAAAVDRIFWTILGVQLLIVTPARALGSLQLETESRTIDLLLLTRLNAWRVVTGKWVSLLAQAGLLLIAMLPYGIVRYFGGSTDLVKDALICCTLFAACGVFTAAGLWASGMPRILRALIPLIAGIGFVSSTMSMGRGPFFGGALSFNAGWVVLWYFNGAIVTVFFLVTTVRRIAPQAESHVLLGRGLPLLAVLPVPIWAWWGPSGAASGQLIFAAEFLAIVCAVELSSMSRPIPSHWYVWADRGTWGRFVGRLVMPGWPSAMLYTLLAGLLVAGATFSPRVVAAADLSRVLCLVALGLSALLFPVIIFSIIERIAARTPGGIYLLTFVSMSVFGVIATGVFRMLSVRDPFLAPLAQVLPVSGFWLTLFADRPLTDGVIIGQVVTSVAVFGVALFQSRYYWWEFALFEGNRRLRQS